MNRYQTHVRLTDNGADVVSGQARFTVGRRDGLGTVHGCPMEYMAGALGSWIALTLSAVAAHKKINLEKVEIGIGYVTNGQSVISTRFAVEVDLGHGLTQREQAIMLNSARKCEVSKILAGQIDFDVALSR